MKKGSFEDEWIEYRAENVAAIEWHQYKTHCEKFYNAGQKAMLDDILAFLDSTFWPYMKYTSKHGAELNKAIPINDTFKNILNTKFEVHSEKG